MSASWLCPTELDRRRLVDTVARANRARMLGSTFVGIGAVVLAPILSWWLLPLFAVGMLNIVTLDPRMRRSKRPAVALASSMAFTEATFAVAAGITGGSHSPLLPLLVLPAGMLAARFRERVVIVGAIIGAVTIVGVGLIVDAANLFDHPALTIVSLGLLGNVVVIGTAIQGAELQHRDEAVLDPLTGLLNRKALRVRFAELEQQATQGQAMVCLIACDLDQFKRVNDTYGHERGDAVLRDAVDAMRRTLRSFELMYRIGGEEFLVVLPRIGLEEGEAIAERLREVVEEAHPGGVEVTASLGVAAAHGAEVEYERLFAAADEALYAAKREGRNRVASQHRGRFAREPAVEAVEAELA